MKIKNNIYTAIAALCIAIAPLISCAQDTVWVRKNAPTVKETYAVSFSADGNKVFSGSECSPSYLRIFNSATGALLWDYTVGSTLMCIQGVKFSSDGLKAAALEEMGNLLLFDYSGAVPILTNTISTGTAGAFSIDYSPAGDKIATGCVSKKMNIYRISDGALLHSIDAHGSWVQSVDWANNGAQIVTAGSDRLVKLWDTAGNLIRTFTGHTAAVQSVKFTQDNRYIVSASKDKTIKIWETATGMLIRTISGHRGFVLQADVADDGTKIVSGSEDSTIRVWDFNTGTQLQSFQLSQSGKVYSVDLSPNGQFVTAGTQNGDVQLWDITSATNVPATKPANLMLIYPNPCTNNLYIETKQTDVYEVTVTDFTGRILVKRPIIGYKTELQLGSLSPGNYMVTTISPDETKSMVITKK